MTRQHETEKRWCKSFNGEWIDLNNCHSFRIINYPEVNNWTVLACCGESMEDGFILSEPQRSREKAGEWLDDFMKHHFAIQYMGC